MRIVIFGLSVSPFWGNGHAAPWRGLITALARAGHRVVFFERDAPRDDEHRDLTMLEDGARLVRYEDWTQVLPEARRATAAADAAVVTSDCPDARHAAALVLDSRAACRCFYDRDTAVTLARHRARETVDYLPPGGLGDFDLVLSSTGGRALDGLRSGFGARRVAPLYAWVDIDTYHPADPLPRYRADLSYIGAYTDDRQPVLDTLFLAPARMRPHCRFLIAGAMYPQGFPWAPNIQFVDPLPATEHAAFYSSSRLTLNVTHPATERLGHCPSACLFEAAACGTPVLTDRWNGLDGFFEPGSEILLAQGPMDCLGALDLPDETLHAIGRRARERALIEHSADRRAGELIALFESAAPERV